MGKQNEKRDKKKRKQQREPIVARIVFVGGGVGVSLQRVLEE